VPWRAGIISAVPTCTNHPRGGRPLDPERPLESSGPGPESPGPEQGQAGPGPGASGSASTGGTGPASAGGTGPASAGAGKRKREEPPGLRAQFAAVKNGVVRFLNAHIALARAEFDLIKAELTRASALAGGAIALAILLAFFVPIGGMLFAGEWIFGSIGWGLLQGTLGLIAVAVTLILVALRVPGLGKDVAGALIVGIAVALVLGFEIPNKIFTWIGETGALGIDVGVRPLVIGLGIFAAIGLVIGLVAGIRIGGGQAIVTGVFAGLFAGAAIGAFLSITFGLRVGIALGVAVFWLTMPILMALRVQRVGIDVEGLKARFIPQVTIDTAKESLEWAKERVPTGPQS
jgi:hypothetical protein